MDQDIDANILIHPRRGKKEKVLPENGILLVNPSEAFLCHEQLKKFGGESQQLFNSNLTVDVDQSFFAAGPAIGSPMAALTLEKLIVLGAKRIILFGWCGAISPDLKVGDILIPSEALAGEGTSQYYPLNAPAIPEKVFRENIVRHFQENNTPVGSGRVWSTDAVYREDRRTLKNLYSTERVIAVDMEFSALCAVACFRNIKFAAVLVVSDELSGKAWRPGFSEGAFLHSKARALKTVVSYISKYKEL
ncbi:MAG: nucleoside phosphorylase [Desulforhopalus sp.]|nr:nucleoside phosphorylase [Desulforhopalus sp.]